MTNVKANDFTAYRIVHFKVYIFVSHNITSTSYVLYRKYRASYYQPFIRISGTIYFVSTYRAIVLL